MTRIHDVGNQPSAVSIPAISRSVVQLMSLSAEDDNYFDAVHDIVSMDPGLTTRLLGIANSVLMSSREMQMDTRTALTRVGPRRLTSVIVGGAVAELFESDQPEIAALLQHSKATAALCRVLAGEFPSFGLDPFVAQTLGLLHNVGALVLAFHDPSSYLEVLLRHNIDSRAILQAERDVMGVDHIATGLKVVRHWSLPSIFSTVIADHHASSAESPPSGTDLTTLVRLCLRLHRMLVSKPGDQIERGVAMRALLHECSLAGLVLDRDRVEQILFQALELLAHDQALKTRPLDKAA